MGRKCEYVLSNAQRRVRGCLLRNEKTFEKVVEYLVPDFLVNLIRPYVPGQ